MRACVRHGVTGKWSEYRHRGWMQPAEPLPEYYLLARELAAVRQDRLPKPDGELARQWRFVRHLRYRGWTRDSYYEHKRRTMWRNVNRITNVKIVPAISDAIFASNALRIK